MSKSVQSLMNLQLAGAWVDQIREVTSDRENSPQQKVESPQNAQGAPVAAGVKEKEFEIQQGLVYGNSLSQAAELATRNPIKFIRSHSWSANILEFTFGSTIDSVAKIAYNAIAAVGNALGVVYHLVLIPLTLKKKHVRAVGMHSIGFIRNIKEIFKNSVTLRFLPIFGHFFGKAYDVLGNACLKNTLIQSIVARAIIFESNSMKLLGRNIFGKLYHKVVTLIQLGSGMDKKIVRDTVNDIKVIQAVFNEVLEKAQSIKSGIEDSNQLLEHFQNLKNEKDLGKKLETLVSIITILSSLKENVENQIESPKNIEELQKKIQAVQEAVKRLKGNTNILQTYAFKAKQAAEAIFMPLPGMLEKNSKTGAVGFKKEITESPLSYLDDLQQKAGNSLPSPDGLLDSAFTFVNSACDRLQESLPKKPLKLDDEANRHKPQGLPVAPQVFGGGQFVAVD